MRKKKIRFVNEEILCKSLPAFPHFPDDCVTPEQKDAHLEGIIDFIEKYLVIEMAEKIREETYFEKLIEVVEMMKGRLDVSWSHYGNWDARCENKRGEKKWIALDGVDHPYDYCDGFNSQEEACEFLLKAIEIKEFK